MIACPYRGSYPLDSEELCNAGYRKDLESGSLSVPMTASFQGIRRSPVKG
jgi:hypothetical protein